MFKQIIDLSLIPFGGPFKHLRGWLLWQLGRMQVSDTLTLPIFSAFKVSRFAEGFILENTATGQIWATSVENYVQLIDYIETQRPQLKPSWHERALIRYATAAKLHKQGLNSTQIAKAINTSKSRAVQYVESYYLEYAN